MSLSGYDFSEAVGYHYGRFPPKTLDYKRLMPSLAAASAALARYDALLRTLHSSEVLLAPLRRREAVISSRIEGTVATLDEILKFEAEDEGEAHGEDDLKYRRDILEVFSYSRAMGHAQRLMSEGLPLSGRLLREAHSRLLFFGRGADKQPGNFKIEQNYVVDQPKRKVLFVPAGMEDFDQRIEDFEEYMNRNGDVPLLQTAIAHAEFESLHPFKDGNRRLGRMLITLMLWDKGLITAPYFYVSGCIEQSKDDYISRLRAISADDDWTSWCEFFFNVIEMQAEESAQTAAGIRELYEQMKEVFRETTGSQWSINALDYVFSKPVFRLSAFAAQSGIPRQTAYRIASTLAENELLSMIEAAAGRRSAIYAFEPLLSLARA